MHPNKYDTLLFALNDLKALGYDRSFNFKDGKMQCIENDKRYGVEDMQVDEQYRFEGMTNPGDNSILFAVRCKDGNKGTIISAYGPEANPKILQFMNKVKTVTPGDAIIKPHQL